MSFNKVVKQQKNYHFVLYLALALLMNNTFAEVGPNWIEQWGIRWTFDKNISADGAAGTYQYGTFVNGDYWVVGPVTIVSVSPETTTFDGNIINGSMVNPSTDMQGYDGRVPASYQADLTVKYPLSLKANNSLVSTESWTVWGDFPTKDVCEINQDLGFSKLKTAAVLTVLAQAAPADAFRPSYFGSDKTIYRESDLDYSKLPNILPPQYLAYSNYDFDDIGARPTRGNIAYFPTVADRFARVIERPWIMHMSRHLNRELHPTDNQPNYYRETYRVMQRIAMLLCCDLDTIYTEGTRRKLVIPTVQLGIDSFYTFTTVMGEREKQNFPILFAGLLMDNQDFLDVQSKMIFPPKPYYEVYYRSDAASTIVSKTIPANQFYNGTTVGWRGAADDREEYEHLDPGPDYDPVTGTHPHGGDMGEWDDITYEPEGHACGGDKLEVYRRIISPQMVGLALASHIMGIREDWKHPAFFDYIVRWKEFEGRGSGIEFIEVMWSEYNWVNSTSYTLTVNAENGTVSLSPAGGIYKSGTVVQLTAEANSGYQFDNWSGDASGTTKTVSITMNANKSVTANFSLIPDPDNGETDPGDGGPIGQTASSPAPVAKWNFNESIPGFARDISGNELHATLNATVDRSADMGSVVFNGTDSYIDCGNNDKLNLGSSMTISAWVKVQNPDLNRYIRIVSKKNPWDSPSGYQMEYNPATNGLFVLGSGSNFARAEGVDLDTNWHHVAAVVEGDQATIYVDGVNRTTDSTISPVVSNDLPLEIGRESETLGHFDGQIDDVILYNQTLTETEVQELYKKGRNNDLTSHYLFDEMNDERVTDNSGCHLDGILVNAPEWGKTWASEEYLRFNGAAQAVEVQIAAPVNAGTLAMLVEPASNSGPQFLFGHVLYDTNMIWLYTISGQLALGLGDNSTLATNIATLSAGELYHVALTWDGTNYCVYVDGNIAASGTYSGLNEFAPTADIANMGTESYRNEGLGFDGIIDDVKIYARTLSANEIKTLMLSQSVRENKEMAFTIYGEDQNGNPYVYTAENLPAGAVFDAATQQFFWRPWYNQSGECQIQFISEDGTDQQTITLSARDVQLSDWYREFLDQQGKL